MSATYDFSRRLPVKHETDVLVAGGGPAGIAAALAAACQGASVLLLEATSALGGMGTMGLVPAFMPFTNGVDFLAGGVGREIHDRLVAADGTCPNGGRSVPIKAEVLKRLYDEMLTEAGVKFIFHCQVLDVDEPKRPGIAIYGGKSGLFAVRAKVLVDGTGDGDLAVRAGARFEQGDAAGNLMPGTLCSLWSGVDWKTVLASEHGTGNGRIEEAIADGVFTHEDRHLPGMWMVGENEGGGNVGHTFGVDGTDEESLTAAYVWGRRSLVEYKRYYQDYLVGFDRLRLLATGPLLGVRETRRILGDYVLDRDDFLARASFADEIGRFSYPIDIHLAKPDKASFEKFEEEFKSMRYADGESYGIPYRILTPTGLDNVLVAGRCVSCDRGMQASIRVMPACFITGQAAGVAAAMMVEGNCDSRAVDLTELQDRLRALGAFLPKVQ